MNIITRKEAAQQGLSRYYTGKPCKHGHITERRTTTGYCEDCNKAKYKANRQDEEYLRKERERNKRWKRANKDKINARRRVRDKEWYVPPPPSPRQIAMEAGEKLYFTGKPCQNGHVYYRKVSCGSCVICKKEYNKTDEARARNRETAKRYRKNNPEAEKAKSKKWRTSNKASVAAKAQRYRCVKMKSTPAWANHDKILVKYLERETMSRVSGVKHHVDHLIPLQGENVCGLHIAANLRVIPARDNAAKSNKLQNTLGLAI